MIYKNLFEGKMLRQTDILFTCTLILILVFNTVKAQDSYESLLINTNNRNIFSLDGKWDIIIDPYENGYYNHQYNMRENGYFKNQKPKEISDLIEYDFDNSEKLNVPGDWNTQSDKLLYYEGTTWYRKTFNYTRKEAKRVFIYFGAVNYKCKVFINGEFIGEHIGGFTPFNFEITNKINDGVNFVILMVNNTRKFDAVPTINTDWWNYGGITRSVKLIETPQTFIEDYFLQLATGSKTNISGWIKLEGNNSDELVKLEIPELDINKSIKVDEEGHAHFSIDSNPLLWTPDNPKLYQVSLETSSDTLKDKVGFRTIQTDDTKVLLNGKNIFLRGICIHEEAPFRSGRANNIEDAKILLGWAKELGCNFVRLAHYPHNEYMVRMADEMGLMVWSEVPVYWTIQWDNEEVYHNAKNQLSEMIKRDKNRAAVVLWSMANETPVNDSRINFLKKMIDHTRGLDPTRLITAALHTGKTDSDPNIIAINDPLGEYLDVIGINQYLGWYGGLPDICDTTSFQSKYNKPVIISEFGAGALQGYFGNKLQRWTEDYQAYVYQKNIPMFDKLEFVAGMTPWLLMDFKSPRRPLPNIQDGWNRKGLVSDKGIKKKAFYLLKEYYKTK
jgi:beta-glucuronidase